MERLANGIIGILDRVVSLGIKPGMDIKDQSAISKANFLFLATIVLAVLTVAEGLRLRQYDILPPAFVFFTGALVCFWIVAYTGRPLLPCLLLIAGLSLYGLASMATGGPFAVEFLLGPVFFPFLYFFCFSFPIALLLFFALLTGMFAMLFIPGHPALVAEYSMELRGHVLAACIFCACAAMLREFMHWRVHRKIILLMNKLEEVAQTDQLTGLYNRRAFLERFSYEASRSQRENLTMSILMLDIDHFKNINDQYGHACGDLALQHLSRLMCAMVRQQDTVARWGGEEFIVLLPQTDRGGAAILAEKMRSALADSSCPICHACGPAAISFTVSLGVYQCNLAADVDANIAQVDTRLYEAKRLGRNRVVS